VLKHFHGTRDCFYTTAAMRVEATPVYDPRLVVLSDAIAICVSLVALWLAFHLRAETTLTGNIRKIGSAIIMGNAIAGMHYTAMAAVNQLPGILTLWCGSHSMGWITQCLLLKLELRR